MQPDINDSAYLWDMRQSALEIQECTAGLNQEDFVGAIVVRRAVERLLEIIGEAARKVSGAFQAAHPEIPWRQIIAQRNVISHNYGDILPERIYSVVVNRLPELIESIDKLVPRQR